MNHKIIQYIKSGHAVSELQKLSPLKGTILKGGPDQFLLAVLAAIGQDDYLQVVSFGEKDIIANVENYCATEYPLRVPNRSIFLKSFDFLITFLRYIISTQKLKPDTILCGIDGVVGLIGLVSAKLNGAKFIFSLHNAIDLPSISFVTKASNKILVKYSDEIIVHGAFLSKQVEIAGGKLSKITQYAATIDANELALIEKYKSNNQREQSHNKVILYVGRLEEDKGVLDLLLAFKALSREDVKLIYIGSGQMFAKLEFMIEKFGLQDLVKLVGQIPYSDIYEYLCNSTVLVAPTQTKFAEGRCKTIVEAFISGVPAIAPDYGPFPYLVDHEENGLLYEADSVSGLTNALERILSSETLLRKLSQGAAESGINLQKEQSFYDAFKKTLN